MGAQNPETAIQVPPTLFLTDTDVAELADWRAAFDALRTVYSSKITSAMVPPRSMARGDGIWLRGLTAVSPNGRHMGCKLISASMTARRASYLVALFDRETMALAALIDGNRITGIRTAATAAVAVDLGAPHKPLRIAVIGSGFEAKGLLSALAAVRVVANIRVFSPTPASRDGFTAEFRALGMAIDPVSSAHDAVSGADVVLCAARSRDETPVLRGDWLEPGMTVVSIGSTLPEQREVDEQVIARAAMIVADMPQEVAHDTGDMLAAARAGIDFSAKTVSLADFISAPKPRDPDAILLYKSVGSALQDVIIAEMLLARARLLKVGHEMPRTIVPVAK